MISVLSDCELSIRSMFPKSFVKLLSIRYLTFLGKVIIIISQSNKLTGTIYVVLEDEPGNPDTSLVNPAGDTLAAWKRSVIPAHKRISAQHVFRACILFFARKKLHVSACVFETYAYEHEMTYDDENDNDDGESRP